MSTRPKTENPPNPAAVLKWLRDCDPATKAMLLLMAIALVRGILYALINPPLSAPDEKGHYDYLASLYESGGRSVEGGERKQPPLYYWLSLPIFAAFAGHTSDLSIYALAAEKVSLLSMFAVRIYSVLLTVATVPIAYWTARTVVPGSSFVWIGTAAFVAVMPQYGWLGASINNDNLARLITSGIILLMVRGLSLGFSPKLSFALVLLAVAGVATKPTTWPISAVIPLVFVYKVLSTNLSGRQLILLAVSVLSAVALSLLGLIQLGALDLVERLLIRWIVPGIFSPDRLLTFVGNLDIWPFVYQFKTFWGSFSTDSILLPSPVYLGLAVFLTVCLAGVLLRTIGIVFSRVRGWPDGTETRNVQAVQIATLALLVFLEWLLSFGRYYANEPLRPDQRIAGWEDDFALMQGRFLFPVIVPIAFLIMWGLEGVLTPQGAKRARWLVMALLIAVDWIALLTLAHGGHSWMRYPE